MLLFHFPYFANIRPRPRPCKPIRLSTSFLYFELLDQEFLWNAIKMLEPKSKPWTARPLIIFERDQSEDRLGICFSRHEAPPVSHFANLQIPRIPLCIRDDNLAFRRSESASLRFIMRVEFDVPGLNFARAVHRDAFCNLNRIQESCVRLQDLSCESKKNGTPTLIQSRNILITVTSSPLVHLAGFS